MAVVTETLSQMLDGSYMEGTKLEVVIFGDIGPNGEDLSLSSSIADHLFVRVIVPVSRSDNRASSPRYSSWYPLKETSILGMNSGDGNSIRVILKRIYDWLAANALG